MSLDGYCKKCSGLVTVHPSKTYCKFCQEETPVAHIVTKLTMDLEKCSAALCEKCRNWKVHYCECNRRKHEKTGSLKYYVQNIKMDTLEPELYVYCSKCKSASTTSYCVQCKKQTQNIDERVENTFGFFQKYVGCSDCLFWKFHDCQTAFNSLECSK